jgi:hypothetical protein
MPGKVIEHMVWKHTSGRTASVRGACPWTRESEKADWALSFAGFTIQHPDGTTGLGRPPFTTREEAQAWVDAHPKFPGMSQG